MYSIGIQYVALSKPVQVNKFKLREYPVANAP